MYLAVKDTMDALPQYEYEHIFVDNCSSDRTAEILRKIAAGDPRVKVILNLRNFGPDRSGANALFRASGDAVISLATDFQDPPELIPEFLKRWESGEKIILGQRTATQEHRGVIYLCRKIYYKLIKAFSDNEEIERVTGFGLFDREVIEWFRWENDPEPFLRNAIPELGYRPYLIPYTQQKRRAGKSSYTFFKYLDTALISMISTTKVPLRLSTYAGILTGLFSFVVALVYLIMKLLYWDSFDAGLAPLVVGLFFIGAVQLIGIGILGEYVGSILTYVKKRPLVVEKERINFDGCRDQKTSEDGDRVEKQI